MQFVTTTEAWHLLCFEQGGKHGGLMSTETNQSAIKKFDLDYKRLFESSPGLYLVLNPDLIIVAVSEAYLQATMTKRHEILGRHLFDVFPDNPTDPTANGVGNLRASLMRVLNDKTTDIMAVQKYDIRNPAFPDGPFETRYWSPINSPVFDEKNNLILIIHRVEDVTEFVQLKKLGVDQEKITQDLRKQAEQSESEIFMRAKEIQRMNQQLIQTNESLAKKEQVLSETRDLLQRELASGQKDLLSLANELAVRKKQLQKMMEEMRIAKDDALRSSQVKSQFLANMSHEIRTPLGIILGFTDLLRDSSLSKQERENFIKRIRHSGQHLLGLLSEILDLTKIEAGHLDLEYANVSIANIFDEVISVLEPSARAKGLILKVAKDKNLPETFITDHTKLRQILINLISNAIKFCDAGAIELTALLDSDTIPNEVQFVIKDCGPGIPENYIPKLFEEFSQADSSMSRSFGGSGLGLALSRKLARALGGDVELLQTSDTGSTFCAHFPQITPTNVLPFPTKKLNDIVHLRGVRILLVDDVPDNIVLVKLLLEKAGAFVDEASNGQEAVEKALAGNYDLILMDLQMPKLNGYEATEYLRHHGYDKPIIALTAHAMKEDRERCLRSGCNDYLAKPVVGPILMQAVQKNLAHQAPHILH